MKRILKSDGKILIADTLKPNPADISHKPIHENDAERLSHL
ncbi:MAG: hypothetical protein RIC95_05775 [Vicingaceae bacterium]